MTTEEMALTNCSGVILKVWPKEPEVKEAVPHLWEKFYKVDKARTRAYGGSGVGLSIVKAIMDLHHRSYGVENYDNGVAFWFELDHSGSAG